MPGIDKEDTSVHLANGVMGEPRTALDASYAKVGRTSEPMYKYIIPVSYPDLGSTSHGQ